MVSRSRLLEVVFVLGFCLFLFFYGLAVFGLTGADEPRYAQVAREMLARHDWVTPVLYGQTWLEKPILYYWQAMVAYRLFGVSDWAARLPSGVLATLMTLAVYLFSLRMRRGMQLDAALMTASAALLLGMARAASTDMSLTAPFAIALLCWYAWHETALSAEAAQLRSWLSRRWLLLAFYAGIALATLAKGPVAPGLAVLIIVVFCLIVRQPRLIAKTLWVPGILCFLAVALPWYVEVQLRNPQFLRVFFLEHNLARFASNLFRHKQPFWYYVPVVLLATAPWTLFTVLGAVDTVKQWWQRQSYTAAPPQQPQQRRLPGPPPDSLPIFLLLWAVIPVVFFSASQSKLPAYILPSIPAFVLLAAICAHDRMRLGRPGAWLIFGQAAICALMIGGVLLAPALMLKLRPSPRALTVSVVAAVLMFLAVAGVLFTKGLTMLRPVTLLPVVLGLAFLIRVASPALEASQSARPAAKFLQGLGVGPGDHVAYFHARREVAYGLAFYRNQSPEVYEGWPLLDANEFASSGTPPRGAFFVLAREGQQLQLQRTMPGREVRMIGFFRPQQLQVFFVSPQ